MSNIPQTSKILLKHSQRLTGYNIHRTLNLHVETEWREVGVGREGERKERVTIPAEMGTNVCSLQMGHGQCTSK